MLEVLCQPAFAGDYAGLRDAVVQETTRTGTSTAIFMGLMAVSTLSVGLPVCRSAGLPICRALSDYHPN